MEKKGELLSLESADLKMEKKKVFSNTFPDVNPPNLPTCQRILWIFLNTFADQYRMHIFKEKFTENELMKDTLDSSNTHSSLKAIETQD